MQRSNSRVVASRFFCFLISAIAILFSCQIVAASNHLEAPLITLEQSNADSNDLFVFNGPNDSSKIYVTAQGSSIGPGPSTNQIVFSTFDQSIDSAAILNAVKAFVDIDTGLDAVFPQIAANEDGTVAVTWLNDTDFFAGPPFQIPNASIGIFDADGTPILPASRLGLPGNGQRPPSLDFVPIVGSVKDGKFTAFFAEGPGNNGFIGGNIIGKRFEADGSIDASFSPLKFFEPFPSPDAFTAVTARSDGGAIVSFVGDSAGGFPSASNIFIQRYDAMGNPVGGKLRINQEPAFNANLIEIGDSESGTSVSYQQINQTTFRPEALLVIVKPDGTVGEPIKVGPVDGLDPVKPAMTFTKDGVTVVTYHSERLAPGVGFDRGNIFAERFAPNGTRIGGPLQVNSITQGIQSNASVDDTADGGFVVGFTTDNTSTGFSEIWGIDLGPPIATGPNTIIADDFATPWTSIDIAGFDITFNSNLPDINNNVNIVADPNNDESTSGVVRFEFGNQGGTLKLDFNDDVSFAQEPVINSLDFTGILQLRATLDEILQNLADVGLDGLLDVEVHDRDDASGPKFVESLPIPLNNSQSSLIQSNTHHGSEQSTQLQFSKPLSPENAAILRGIENPRFSYSLSIDSQGPAVIYLDNLRIDLIVVPEPASIILLLAGCRFMLGRRKLTKQTDRASALGH